MSGNPRCTVFIGNVDARVSDRVLYDILIQAGRLVELCVPRDKETDRPKGYAFAEYETEEVADYSVRLFSGLVTLYNRTLKFAVHRLNEEIPPTPQPDHHRYLLGPLVQEEHTNVHLARHWLLPSTEHENLQPQMHQQSVPDP